MTVSETERRGNPAPGLSQLGLRLLLGAFSIVLFLVLAQRWSAQERAEREAFPMVSGTIRIAGLPASVELLRDARGIPHIFSEQEPQGWFGLGFAHAQDRLAQMISLRRRALGRSAEIEGASALRVDRVARLLEIGPVSRETVELLPEESRQVLESYAAGVNARIQRLRQGRVRPPRDLLGGVAQVEPWTPADSIALVKLFSWCIGGTLETTLVLDDLIQRLDSVPARPFFPGRASVDFGVAPEIPQYASDPATVKGPLADAVMGTTDVLCRGVGVPSGGAWIVGGSRTESGAPILVADWHVEPSVPGLFYEARVDAGGIDVAGATLPGSPIFWIGRTPNLAWAGVPASAPISDLFIETLREEDERYQNGTLWAPVESRSEVLRWRGLLGELESTEMVVRATRHGPLLDSLWDERETAPDPERPGRAARALSWTGARPGDGLTSMLALTRSRSVGEAQQALARHHEPVLAFALADRGGAGRVQVAGWLPNRPLPTGLVPVQGRLRSFDWREPVPPDALPGETLGPRGWLMALDQPWPGRGGLEQTEWLWRSGDRATRLEALLGEQALEAPLNLRNLDPLLEDERAPRAKRVVTAIVGLARRGGRLPVEAEEIAALLERWDGRFAAASAGAAAYHVIIGHLLEDLLRLPFGPGLYKRYLASPHVQPQTAIERLVLRAASLRQPGGWTDEERVIEAVRRSLRETWVTLNHRLGPGRDHWAWGALHRVRFDAPLLKESAPAEPLAVLPSGGSGQTLSFSGYAPGRSFDVELVSLYRAAFDLGAGDQFLSRLIPGQVEHAGHPHRIDGLADGGGKGMVLFPLSRLVVEEENPQRLVLEPAL